MTFVFNGGPGASSAYLHVGAVGPQCVDLPADGTLPPMPPGWCRTTSHGSRITDLVFVDAVGTGFSGIIENNEKKKDGRKNDDDHHTQGDEPDPKE